MKPRPRLTIVDYGTGNLLSVSRAFEHCGADVLISSSPADVLKADRLVLPGVGAFKNGMDELTRRGLAGAIRDYATFERPFLGICLGMQMMLETSEEFGMHEGLGLIPGSVLAIPHASNGVTRKIPHIGWNTLRLGGSIHGWEQSILDGLTPETASTYFVHSYSVQPLDPSYVLAECMYDGCPVTAAVSSGLIYGCQFHPEKSGETGLTILRNFCRL